MPPFPTIDAATSMAATARSILACPAGAGLVVDGLDGLDGEGPGSVADPLGAEPLGVQDVGGHPTFSCPPGTALTRAGRAGRPALLTLESAVGPLGSPTRDAVLSIGGELCSRGRQSCDCCIEARETVMLEVGFVMLAPHPGAPPIRVPLEQFHSPAHDLNRGFLQRSAEHATTCHQQELRRAVAAAHGCRLAEVAGVCLSELSPDAVELRWVMPDGAHRELLRFPQTARTPEELGTLLRDGLRCDLC